MCLHLTGTCCVKSPWCTDCQTVAHVSNRHMACYPCEKQGVSKLTPTVNELTKSWADESSSPAECSDQLESGLPFGLSLGVLPEASPRLTSNNHLIHRVMFVFEWLFDKQSTIIWSTCIQVMIVFQTINNRLMLWVRDILRMIVWMGSNNHLMYQSGVCFKLLLVNLLRVIFIIGTIGLKWRIGGVIGFVSVVVCPKGPYWAQFC